jgi:glycosyltransferase involved in cell wall biosynthesis
MISVVIPTHNSEESLPRCFEALIQAAMGGLVREVIVADGGSRDGTATIADAAGAHLVVATGSRAERLAAGAKTARSDWLLFLDPATALEAGWEAEAQSFLEQTPPERPRAAVFRFALDGFGPAARRKELRAHLRTSLFGLPDRDQGLLLPRRLYHKLGGHRATAMEDIDLVRRIGRSRLVTLRARAIKKIDGGVAERSLALTMLHAFRVPRGVVALLGG